MHETCCPAYTIRLNVNDFAASKSQRKYLRKVDKLLSASAQDAPTATGTSTSTSSRMTMETVPAEVTAERFELYKKYQVAVHHDLPEDITPEKFGGFLVDSCLVRCLFKITSYVLLLYFYLFVNSRGEGEEEEVGRVGGRPRGTWHQLHRLEGRLVAVGVLVYNNYYYYDYNYY